MDAGLLEIRWPVKVESDPVYPVRFSGTCLVAGSAWCVEDDIWNARRFRPDAKLIAVNRTVKYFHSDLMVAVDAKKSEPWKKEAERKFGKIELHGGRTGVVKPFSAYPWYDYFWPNLQNGGTTVLLACKIAAAIGFTEIIVCGAPLMRGPYVDNEDDWSRRGYLELKSYRDPWIRDKWLHPLLRSMSGWTRELLGGPK